MKVFQEDYQQVEVPNPFPIEVNGKTSTGFYGSRIRYLLYLYAATLCCDHIRFHLFRRVGLRQYLDRRLQERQRGARCGTVSFC